MIAGSEQARLADGIEGAYIYKGQYCPRRHNQMRFGGQTQPSHFGNQIHHTPQPKPSAGRLGSVSTGCDDVNHEAVRLGWLWLWLSVGTPCCLSPLH